MRKRKTFAFSPSNFLVGASEFSAEETGAYIRLLCIQFEKVGIPSGDAKLCELTGTGIEVIRKVKKKFSIAMEVDGEKRLFNERLLKDMRIPHTPLKNKSLKEEATPEPHGEPTKIAMPRDSETEIRKEYEALTKGIREVSEFIRKHRPRFIVPYIDLWNMFADKHKLPRVQQANENRKRKVACRAKEEMFDFPSILGKAKEQSFLLSGTWFTFDWLITNDTNYLKVLEGNYKGKEAVTTKTEQTVYEGSFLGAKKSAAMKQGDLKPQTEGQIMNIMFDLIAHHCCIRHPNFDYYPRPNKSKMFRLAVKRGAVWKKKLLSKKKRI